MLNEHIISVNLERCIGCGLCRSDCPASNIAIENNKAVICSQDCIKCGHCVAVCPKSAVSISGFDDPPVEIDGPTTLDPKQLLNAVRSRRTIRRFKDGQVAPEIVADIIEAGRWTPTGKNAQDVSYLVLTESKDKYEKIAVRFFKKLRPFAKLFVRGVKNASIDDNFFFKKAPLVIAVLSKDKVNAALAASNMELMAQAHGLGVLYSGYFSAAVNHSFKLKKALRLKRGDKVVTTLVLGYSAVNYFRTAQKERAQVRTTDSY